MVGDGRAEDSPAMMLPIALDVMFAVWLLMGYALWSGQGEQDTAGTARRWGGPMIKVAPPGQTRVDRCSYSPETGRRDDADRRLGNNVAAGG